MVYSNYVDQVQRVSTTVNRQEHETIDFGGQEVRDQGQGQTGPNINLESWGSHHCRPPWVEQLFKLNQ